MLAVRWLSAQQFVTLQGMPEQSAYLDSLYNPVPQGNWPHSLTTYSALILKIATYVETDPGSLLRSY